MEKQQRIAVNWFRQLRDDICREFEALEKEFSVHQPPSHPATQPPYFLRTSWQRPDGGGGEMSLMRGNVFEKVGVNISTVHGEFSETMRKEIPGANENPHFWASGISLVAHMRSPLVPAVHMNTRMIVLSGKEARPAGRASPEPGSMEFSAENSGSTKKHWFGGGADLTPMYPDEKDTADFHAAFKAACDASDPAYYPKFKKWCDEYFFLKHRNEPRGQGGIFYDYLNTGDWQKDFEFTQAVGKAFLDVYPKLVRRHMYEKWTDEQREHQLKKRGRYVEFNLLYDRGTKFGLQTGGNVEAILMSLPPEVTW